jgi:hypothetical protein
MAISRQIGIPATMPRQLKRDRRIGDPEKASQPL